MEFRIITKNLLLLKLNYDLKLYFNTFIKSITYYNNKGDSIIKHDKKY